MAFASFGILTPVLSVVLSVFMLGLAVGAWIGGKMASSRSKGPSALTLYACTEFLIGVGAFAAPKFFVIGEHLLLSTGEMNSFGYLSVSALILAVSLLPWCLCMGATFPLMMACVRERDPENTKSFSYLYLANVLGAMSGTLVTALLLVELLGFRHTLWIAATGNFSIALISGCLARNKQALTGLHLEERRFDHPVSFSPSAGISKRLTKWILFSTGFGAMAMEVVWTRAFTPVLSTQVYSFAMVVFVYLLATFAGALLYRRDLRKGAVRSTAGLLTLLFPAVFLPVLVNDPRLVMMNATMQPGSVLILLASIFPLCAILGYLTPYLIDDYAAGDPATAGRAYAVNVLGCILGPLFASYVLLPSVSERHALIILGCPFLFFSFLCFHQLQPRTRWILVPVAIISFAVSLFVTEDFQSQQVVREEIRRDYAASVISIAGPGSELNKGLFVNGINVTLLTPITKFMVHLPLAYHQGPPPTSALIICFGMGTSFRSAMSWNLQTTAVELVPSVKEVFPFYHKDALAVLARPNGRVIVDDGRRYLKRTQEKFDVIVIDPPPPETAAGSSLLYSREFYELAKQHLKTNGILQTWYPVGALSTGQAMLRSVCDSFPYVRCFGSIEGWGMHILASMEPIPPASAEALVARMPASARADLLEWSAFSDRQLPSYLQKVLATEFQPADALNTDPEICITDDMPYNEYFFIRRLLGVR